MKALVISHKTNEDLGIFKKILETRNFKIDFYLGYQDALKNISPKDHDLVIFLGGPMGVYQAEEFPYLSTEIDFIKRRIDVEKPYLGVCLGAQLLAAALGSNVYPGKQGKEIGWKDIHLTPEGKNSPVRHLEHTKTKMMEWHGDTFDRPEGITLLASSEMYAHQAYSFGKNILGFQCHPEVTMDNIELWLATGYNELKQNGTSVQELRDQSQKNMATLNKQSGLFLNEWLDAVL